MSSDTMLLIKLPVDFLAWSINLETDLDERHKIIWERNIPLLVLMNRCLLLYNYGNGNYDACIILLFLAMLSSFPKIQC